MKIRKKSKYKHTLINKKIYYFYKITWLDICGDSGWATKSEFDKFMPSRMVSQAYIYSKDKKLLRTFSSHDVDDELFGDRNVYPMGCVVKLEKILL